MAKLNVYAPRLKGRGWKKIFHANGNDKKGGYQYSYQTK